MTLLGLVFVLILLAYSSYVLLVGLVRCVSDLRCYFNLGWLRFCLGLRCGSILCEFLFGWCCWGDCLCV